MLYHILYPLHDAWSIFNVFRYITFRTIYATVTSLLFVLCFGPYFINMMKRMQLGEEIREDGPESHFSKAGTPTMGGILIVAGICTGTLLWADLTNIFIWAALAVLITYALLGLGDDLIKVKKISPKGLSGKWKIAVQAVCGLLAIILVMKHGSWDTQVYVPFLKNIHPDLGIAYPIFALLVIVGASNALNLTDGLDGLATGPFVISAAVYALFTYLAGNARLAGYLQIPYVPGAGELTIFCGAMVGAGLGFLWYNSYPAEIFMGDVGSLAIGGALGVAAIFSKQEILLCLVGGLFVMEALSVIIQVAFFKITHGKRVFKMAPLHHHFELMGWPEPKITVRLWILSILLGLVAVSTLKLR